MSDGCSYHRFATEQEARDSMKKQREWYERRSGKKKRNNYAPALYVEQCQQCNGAWHVKRGFDRL